jgi:hypothetical protein
MYVCVCVRAHAQKVTRHYQLFMLKVGMPNLIQIRETTLYTTVYIFFYNLICFVHITIFQNSETDYESVSCFFVTDNFFPSSSM